MRFARRLAALVSTSAIFSVTCGYVCMYICMCASIWYNMYSLAKLNIYVRTRTSIHKILAISHAFDVFFSFLIIYWHFTQAARSQRVPRGWARGARPIWATTRRRAPRTLSCLKSCSSTTCSNTSSSSRCVCVLIHHRVLIWCARVCFCTFVASVRVLCKRPCAYLIA